MARLAAQEKMEYYPTPEKTIERILSQIEFKTPIRALDPCAGDGRALRILKEKYNAEVYGIELDAERSKQTAEITCNENCLIETDALTDARITAQAFNFIFNNPPYDWERGYGDKRLELTFIERYASPLVEDGIMVLIINESLFETYGRLKELLTVIFKNYAVINFFDMTEDKTYKQWVLLLRKAKTLSSITITRLFNSDNELEDEIYNYNRDYNKIFKIVMDLSEFLRPNLKHDDFSLAVAPKPIRFFKSVSITKEMLESAVKLNDKQIHISLEPVRAKDVIETLLPLRNSHLPLLLPTGHLNGRIEGTNLVINGQVERFIESYEETEEKQDKNGKTKTQTVNKEINKFRAKLSVLDLKTKQVYQIN